MTVAELIKELQNYNPNAIVGFLNEELFEIEASSIGCFNQPNADIYDLDMDQVGVNPKQATHILIW